MRLGYYGQPPATPEPNLVKAIIFSVTVSVLAQLVVEYIRERR